MIKDSVLIHSGQLSAVQLGLEGGVIGNFIGNSADFG